MFRALRNALRLGREITPPISDQKRSDDKIIRELEMMLLFTPSLEEDPPSSRPTPPSRADPIIAIGYSWLTINPESSWFLTAKGHYF